jgi:hypothetical protein
MFWVTSWNSTSKNQEKLIVSLFMILLPANLVVRGCVIKTNSNK